jgi:hypothetical protein
MGRTVGADRFLCFRYTLDGRVVLPKRAEGVKPKRGCMNKDKAVTFLQRACRWGLQVRSIGI